MTPHEYWDIAHFIENHIDKHHVSFKGALILWKAKKAMKRKVTILNKELQKEIRK